MKFYAAFKGVDLDEDKQTVESNEDKLERLKRRAAAKLAGMQEDQIDKVVEYQEIADFGLDIEVEE